MDLTHRSLMLGLLLAAAAPAFADPGAPPRFYAMDTSFQRAGLTPAQQLDLVKELGCDGISWTERTPEDAKAAVEEAEKRGLKLMAIYCAGRVTPGGDLTTSPALPKLMETLKGHDTIIWLHLGGQGPAFDGLTGEEPLVKKLRALADTAAENGLRIALYPHVGEWTARFGDATKLAKVVKHPQFGVCFNLCHCLAMGDEQKIPALLEDAKSLLFTVTLSGADTGVTGANWGKLIQPLNQGTFDQAGLLRKLQALGFRGPVGFQGFGIQKDARTLLTPTVAAWKKLLLAVEPK